MGWGDVVQIQELTVDRLRLLAALRRIAKETHDEVAFQIAIEALKPTITREAKCDGDDSQHPR